MEPEEIELGFQKTPKTCGLILVIKRKSLD